MSDLVFNWRQATVLTGLILGMATADAASAPVTSKLWGLNGELFDPAGRLPDVSYAGYQNGAVLPPVMSEVVDAADYGANGKDTLDDTVAIQSALDAATNGVVLLPAGTYYLRSPLRISKSKVVLRGAGVGKTILLPQIPIDTLLGLDSSVKDANYGKTAYIEIVGGTEWPSTRGAGGTKLATVTAAAKRGDTKLTLANVSGLAVGQEIRLLMTNPEDNSLGCYYYGGASCTDEDIANWYNRKSMDWVVKIASISGKTVTLARPLRLNIQLNWKPEVWSYAPSIKQSGVEDLSIRFPRQKYASHHREPGWHAVWIGYGENCWARNLEILEADRGIEFTGSNRGYVGNVRFGDLYRRTVGVQGEERYGIVTGHYGISFNNFTQDTLAEDIDVDAHFVHSLSVASYANGNVYSGIKVLVATFDHHGAAPHENVYTDILVRENADPFFQSGGGLPSAAFNETFWNIRRESAATIDFPSGTSGSRYPVINLIGIARWPSKTGSAQWIEKDVTVPENIYEAQLIKRLGSATPPPVADKVSATVRLDMLNASQVYNLSVANSADSAAAIVRAVVNIEGLKFDLMPVAPGFTVSPADVLAKNDSIFTFSATLNFSPALAAGLTKASLNGDMDPAASGVAEPSKLTVSITYSNGKILSGTMAKQGASSWVFTGSN